MTAPRVTGRVAAKANEPWGIVPGRVILDDGREVIGARDDIAGMRGKVPGITNLEVSPFTRRA